MPDIDDARLRAAVENTQDLTTVAEVLLTLRGLDGVIQPGDGLKWFNHLYLSITAAFDGDISLPAWQDSSWIQLLDVKFAQLYFEAVMKALTDFSATPKCWSPLFEARTRPGLAKIQLALAGMNAHINHDLSIAVVRTCEAHNIEPSDGSPQHADFLRVNSILKAEVDDASDQLLEGVPGTILSDVQPVRDTIAIWSVTQARNAAWDQAKILWALRGTHLLANNFLFNLDRLTGLVSRSLLVPVA